MKRVVVTGIGAITPIGNNAADFWEGLINGKNGIAPITSFDTTDFKATLAAEVKDFDPTNYMEKGEARKLDRYAQFAMVSADEAVSDSGIAGNVDPERFGVYFASGIGGFHTFCEEDRKFIQKGAKRVSPHFITKLILNLSAGNIAIKHNAKGPCISPVTACATGTTNIGEAFRAIRHGYADAIIAGGAEAAILDLGVAGFTNCMALCTGTDPDAASIPFDARRSGFVMGEGAAALVLEEYEHAKARGAKIYAEVCGYGSTCDAYHVTAPSPDASGPARAIKDALAEAGAAGNTNVYLNAHGTSTPLNDKTETLAIKKAFGEEDAKKISISSTKSMTGHMLGAAGAVEAIASILALNNGIIPPTIGYKEPDPECDLDYTPNEAKKRDIDYAVSTSLGFGGHNACIIFKKAE